MKILITSGGTKVALDTVRHIGNMSHGTLGARMGVDFLDMGHEIVFFKAGGSKSPALFTIDLARGYHVGDFTKWYNHVAPMIGRYSESTYKTFEDYQVGLYSLIKSQKPDVIILAAAVSDYAPETAVNGKIRSKGDLDIHLQPLPKVIANVREWAGSGAYVVGFKLLVDAPEEELIQAATDSLDKNRLDMVCANDLRTLLNGDHRIKVVTRTGITEVGHTELSKEIAKSL